MLVVGGNATMEIQTANSKRPGAKKIVIHFDFMDGGRGVTCYQLIDFGCTLDRRR